MPGEILLDAHGAWDPGSRPAYALVPKGSRLLYFTDNLSLFLDSNQARDQLRAADPSQTVEALKWAQNYTVSPAPETDSFIVPDGMTRKVPDTRKLLCTSDACGTATWHNPAVCAGLFSDPDFENATIYFAVCRYVRLRRAGDTEYYATTGVNQPETDDDLGFQLSNSEIDRFLDGLVARMNDEDAAREYVEFKDRLSEDQRDMLARRVEERMPGWAAARGIT